MSPLRGLAAFTTMLGGAGHPVRVPSMFNSLEVQVLYPV